MAVCSQHESFLLSNTGTLWKSGKFYFYYRVISSVDTFTEVEKFKNIISIETAGNSLICLDINGNLFSFGCNYAYSLGIGDETYSKAEIHKVKIPTIKSIHSGEYFTICIDYNDSIWSFGTNDSGQCGIGRSTIIYGSDSIKVPTQIKDVCNITEVFVLENRTFCRDINDDFYGFGDNSNNILGIYNLFIVYRPRKLNLPDGIIKIAGGERFTLILLSNGDILGIGLNNYGQLCNLQMNVFTWTKIGELGNISNIVCGTNNTFCLDNDGFVWFFGRNIYLVFGIEEENVSNPKCITDIPPIFALPSKIKGNSIILKDFEANLWISGNNTDGQLGINEPKVKKFIKLPGDNSHLFCVTNQKYKAKSARN